MEMRCLFEQILVSTSVLKFEDKMPSELTEYHRKLLQGIGLTAQAISTFQDFKPDDWMTILDHIDRMCPDNIPYNQI